MTIQHACIVMQDGWAAVPVAGRTWCARASARADGAVPTRTVRRVLLGPPRSSPGMVAIASPRVMLPTPGTVNVGGSTRAEPTLRASEHPARDSTDIELGPEGIRDWMIVAHHARDRSALERCQGVVSHVRMLRAVRRRLPSSGIDQHDERRSSRRSTSRRLTPSGVETDLQPEAASGMRSSSQHLDDRDQDARG
jgi:hypothetical protein